MLTALCSEAQLLDLCLFCGIVVPGGLGTTRSSQELPALLEAVHGIRSIGEASGFIKAQEAKALLCHILVHTI